MNKLNSMWMGALLAASMVFAGPYDTWSKYRTVTVDANAAGITGTVTNFPLLVRLTDVDASTGKNVLDSALANGADIRFTTADGQTALAYQIDSWSATSAAIWVKVPSVSGTGTTSIRMYWGKGGSVSESNGNSVFDSANGYRGVWHMGDGDETTPRANALSIGHTAVPRNFATGYTAPAGLIGKADSLSGGPSSGTPTYLMVDSGTATSLYNFPGGAYTYTGWINPSKNDRFARWISLATEPAGSNRIFSATNSNGQVIGRHGTAGTSNPTNSTAVPVLDTWNHYAMTIVRSLDGTRDTSKIYLNGVQVGIANFANAGNTAFPDSARTYVFMGRDFISAADSTFKGKLDEPRLANATRSADWIKLEFETQKPTVTAVTLGTTQSTGAAPGPYDAWTNTRSIRLNTGVTGANVSGDVTNFPVLIRLTPAEASIFSTAKAGGADIRFAKATVDTALPYQIERWDATAQRAEIWVKVDTVKGNDSTQSIRMFYGNNAAASQSNGRAVFDTALGYSGVWHLGDTTALAPRPNAITGRFKATPVSFAPGYQVPSGVIGKADRLTGGVNADSTAFLAINEGTPSTQFNFPAGKFTYTAWINPVAADNFARLISLVSADAGEDRIFLAFQNGNIVGRVWGTGTGNPGSRPTNSSTPPVIGEWNHVAMTVSRGAGMDTTRLYLNGDSIAQAVHDTMSNVQRNFVRIGKDYINVNDNSYNGLIDEARISEVKRSADYIKLSYASQGTFQKFTNIGMGVATAPEAPVSVTASAGPANSGSVIVSWTAGANGGAAITGYAVTASPGTATCTATPPTTTCTVNGLTPGTPYTFTVKATNSVGTSAASAATSPVTPTGIQAPKNFILSVNGQVRPFTYRLPAAMMANTDKLTMSISDVHGRTVWSKTVNPRNDKVGELTWNGENRSGARVSAGMYLVRVNLVSDGKSHEFTQKAIDLTPSR